MSRVLDSKTRLVRRNSRTAAFCQAVFLRHACPLKRSRRHPLTSDGAGAVDAVRPRGTVSRVLASLCVAVVLLVAVGSGSDDGTTTLLGGGENGDGTTSPGGGSRHLVTQFFAIFNDNTTDNFHACLNLNPPYDLWDITFIAFLHTYNNNGVYVADYENARGRNTDGQPIPPAPGDTDRDRIRQLQQAARKTNPNMKFIVSLGWGSADFSSGAQNPIAFASSVGAIVEENDLDGFDVDFESDDIERDAFRAVSQALRAELDVRGQRMQKRLYLTITPADLVDLDVVNQYYDYVQIQSYDALDDAIFEPTSVIGQGVDSAKILFGRDLEGGDTLASNRYDIPDVVAYVSENRLAGLMGWRVNASNQMTGPMPLFSGVRLLGNAFKAH